MNFDLESDEGLSRIGLCANEMALTPKSGDAMLLKGSLKISDLMMIR
jgi:hypothetical protein